MRSSKPSEPISNGRATRPRNNTSATEISADDLDDEDAAKVLEEIAMGKGIQEPGSRRMSVASRPTAQHYRIPNGNLTSVFCEEALLEDDMARLARQQEIFPIHSALAISQGVCDELLSIYFRRMDWSWKVHHEPTFLAEYQEYRSLQASGQYNLIVRLSRPRSSRLLMPLLGSGLACPVLDDALCSCVVVVSRSANGILQSLSLFSLLILISYSLYVKP